VSTGGAAAHERRAKPSRLHGLMWAGFSTAAVITALIVPVHILVQGVLGPLGLAPSFDRRYSTFAAALGDPLVKVYLLLLFAASFYMFGWRVWYVLVDLGVHAKLVLPVVTFGLAALGTVIAAYVLFSM
jgi:fumarate reductase subunit D